MGGHRIVVIFFGILMLLSCGMKRISTENKSPEITNSNPMVIVEKNERGVLFRKFTKGIDTSKVYLPGEYSISSFDRLIKYNIDPVTEENNFRTKTNYSKTITLSIQYSYKIIPEKVALMEYYIGNNYPESIVKARIQSSVEKFISKLNSSTIDTSSQNFLEENIFSTAQDKIRQRYVELYDLKILNLSFE